MLDIGLIQLLEPEEITARLAELQVLVRNDHFVYAAGDHGSAYFAKDLILPHTEVTASICYHLAQTCREDRIEAVVAPATAGIGLTQWLAWFLNTSPEREVLALYAEKTADGFALQRGYDKLINGKRVLVAEDVLTTGSSVVKVIDLVRQHGGEVTSVVAICNRGSITAEKLGVPFLRSFLDLDLSRYPVASCPLCAEGRLINTSLGHGTTYVAAHGQPSPRS